MTEAEREKIIAFIRKQVANKKLSPEAAAELIRIIELKRKESKK